MPAAPGAPAQQAADLPFAVEGVRAQHIDDDLILDLAVWGDQAVLGFYMMRVFGCVPAAVVPALVLTFKKKLKKERKEREMALAEA